MPEGFGKLLWLWSVWMPCLPYSQISGWVVSMLEYGRHCTEKSHNSDVAELFWLVSVFIYFFVTILIWPFDFCCWWEVCVLQHSIYNSVIFSSLPSDDVTGHCFRVFLHRVPLSSNAVAFLCWPIRCLFLSPPMVSLFFKTFQLVYISPKLHTNSFIMTRHFTILSSCKQLA